MLKLLLLELGQYPEDRPFEERFTISLPCLAEDAKDCSRILVPIQKQFRWVLEGFQNRLDHENQKKWSSSSGEFWWLPPEQSTYVREQLKKTSFDLIEQASALYSDLFETIDRHKMNCEEMERLRSIVENAPDLESREIWAESFERIREITERSYPNAKAAEERLASYGLDCESKYALSQRFDVVPKDFEASLYVDFAEFLRSGGSIQPCGYCGQTMPVNAHQQARARKGKPVYHPECHMKHRIKTKSQAYRSAAQDPLFLDREKERLRQYRAGVKASKARRRKK